MAYRLVRSLVRGFIRLIARVDLQGLEKFPPSGPCIVVSNHLGRLDAALPYVIVDRPDMTLLIAEKYQENPIFRWLVRHLDAMFIDRYNADLTTVRSALARLKKGNVLVIAPEGTRSPTGALTEGQAGSSYLAAKAGAPLLPVAVTDTEDWKVFGQLRRLRRVRVKVRVGDPFFLPPLKGSNREALLKEYTDEVMVRIAALLPPKYWGVYAGHPRLDELLAERAQVSSPADPTRT